MDKEEAEDKLISGAIVAKDQVGRDICRLVSFSCKSVLFPMHKIGGTRN